MKLHKHPFLSAALILLCLSGCATTNIDSYADYDARVDFTNYQTFSWISDHPMVSSRKVNEASNPFMESRIQDAISKELRTLGYTFKPVGSDADFVVSFSVAARKEMSIESYPTAYRGTWRWGGAYLGDSVSVNSTTEGMLSIDLFDGETKSPAWHGRASKSLTSADKKLRSSIINDAVAEILKQFPPAAY